MCSLIRIGIDEEAMIMVLD